MKTSSAKSKGRRACQEAKEMLCARMGFEADDVRVTSSGVTGEDLLLSPRAQERLPLTFEVKNHEKINIWDAYTQAQRHALSNGRSPAVIFKRNHSRLMICMSFDHFLDCLK